MILWIGVIRVLIMMISISVLLLVMNSVLGFSVCKVVLDSVEVSGVSFIMMNMNRFIVWFSMVGGICFCI